jgi:GNAT superfamily N-acetyltransferase
MRVREGDVGGADETRLLDHYFAFREAAFPPPGGYVTHRPEPADYAPGRGVFLVVEDDEGRAVGCAGVRLVAGEPLGAELKHVWLEPDVRGRGWADVLLDELERHARDLGAGTIVLDTHDHLASAGRLYSRHGYTETSPYNTNPNATRWYRKVLGE